MATEEKKYLVNVESNLDKYAKDAAKAREEVERLTLENFKMQASDKATTEEKEKSSAALRNAQKEYRDAKKAVDLQTQANTANINSRKQLNAIVTLEQKRLGALANTYTINEKGVRVLSQAYIDQVQKLKGAKDAVISYDKAQGDGRSSVGLYSEAIEKSAGQFAAIPGPIGMAGNAISRYSKILLANPIVLIITAIVGAIALLVKGFKNSQKLMDIWDATAAAIGATFKVLLDRVSNFAEFIGSIFSKELRESRKEARLLNDELIGIEDTMTRREKRELRRAAKKGLFEEIKEEAAMARQLRKDTQDLEDAEIDFITTKARLTREIQEKINAVKDETLTDTERLASIDEAIKMQEILTAKEVEFAEERARISQIETDLGNSTREELRANMELQAAAEEAQAAGLKRQKMMLSERLTLVNKVAKEEAALALQVAKDANTAEMERFRSLVNEKKLVAIQLAEETGADVLQVHKQYAAAEVEIAKLTSDEKLALGSNFAGDIAQIFGENTAIGKAAAVAQTTINTYAAAMAAYKSLAGVPIVGPALGIAAAGAAIAAGVANVKKIVAVKSGLPGDTGGGASIPTTITTTPAAQRSFASPVSSSFFTQPQLTQQQLNVAPQNLLTATDIANAISKLPNPVVSVEAYENVAKAKTKVEVRAVI